VVSRETDGPSVVPDEAAVDARVARIEPPHDLPPWLAAHREDLAAFAGILADIGVTRGLIGPREVPRLWERHLLNCAVVADPALGLIGPGTRVGDVGSGAGLPGVVWAIVRPDIAVVLIEPLLRRSTFLAEAVAELRLGGRVAVWRGRAEEAAAAADWSGLDVVTARAVAPLDRLVGWTVPLLRPGGRLVALKGSSAQQELDAARGVAEAAGLRELAVLEVGAAVVDPPTTLIIGTRLTAE
jgi:16S rRNA (guanine527-N7)-methyltransferase